MDQPGIHTEASSKREELGTQAAQVAKAAAGKELTLVVTPQAIAEVVRLHQSRRAEGKAAEGLRIGLRGGGCDGFSYVFEWADKPADPKRDHVLEFDLTGAQPPVPGSERQTVRVFVDRKSMLYLAGTTLNFVSGLMGHGFKFENPNVKGSCGCGESVQF